MSLRLGFEESSGSEGFERFAFKSFLYSHRGNIDLGPL